MAKGVRLAIFSPFESLSETFIKAHKKLPFKISYYSNGLIPTNLESAGQLSPKSKLKKVWWRVFSYAFNLTEKALIASLRKEKINCILAEYGPTAVESLRVIRHLKIALVVHFHGYDVSQIDTIEKYRKDYLELFDYANAVIGVSKKMKTNLIELGCPADKIFLNPCGPDDLFLEINPEFLRPDFISIGRFVDKKAPYYSIAAFKIVNDQFPESRLIMIGDGPLLNTCKNLVSYFDIEGRVEFKGFQTPEEIRTLLKNSVAFIQHSIIAADGDSEGTPVSVLEAQASGLPVISTNHAGIPEVVIHELTGLLTEEHDVEGMAKNMIKVLQNRKLAKQLGENGRNRVKEFFTLEMHLNILSDIIRKAVIENES